MDSANLVVAHYGRREWGIYGSPFGGEPDTVYGVGHSVAVGESLVAVEHHPVDACDEAVAGVPKLVVNHG